jgi:glycosyltransferase involved in cell wall biosynthesis
MVDLVLVTSRQQELIFRQRTNGWNIRFLQLSRITIKQDKPMLRLTTRNPGKLIFVALNIVNPAKGLFVLDQAFRSLQKKYSQVELHIYGLSERTESFIKYMGPYEDKHLDEILATADFGILPSIWHEAFGYVGPEMLSRGLPVIASNRGAMPDYVMHGVNGMLFDPDVPNSLEDCITEILEDQNLRTQLWKGTTCGDRHFLSMKQHTEKLLTFYHSVCRIPITRHTTDLPV